MSTNKIEKNGILCFENFISESELIESSINVEDKYPSWDGEIRLYKQSNHNGKKDLLHGRIPVQVKSTKRKWEKKETFRMDVSDLKNYANDGGIILIRPIFLNTTHSYRIFVSVLLPVDIHKILGNSEAKTRSIKLKCLKNLEHLKTILNYFLENRKLQFNYNEKTSSEYLLNGEHEIVVKSVQTLEEKTPFLSEITSIYLKEKHDLLIPTSLELESFQAQENVLIEINGDIYFKSIKRKYSRDNSVTIILNSALQIIVDNGKLHFRLDINDNTLIQHISKAIDFMEKAIEHRKFEFGGETIQTSKIENNSFSKSNYKFWYDIIGLLKLCKFNTNTMTKGDLNDSFEKISHLVEILLENREVQLKDSSKPYTLKTFKVANKTIILLFQKISADFYIGQNFLATPPPNIEIVVNETPIRGTSFLTLFTIYKFNLYKYIDAIIGFEDDLKVEITKTFDKRLMDLYTQLLLGFIAGYDHNFLPNGLDLATWLIDFLSEKSLNEYENDILFINKIQIVKRQNNLNTSQIRLLLSLYEKYKEKLDMQCCILILLDELSDFKNQFEKLDDNKQIEFKNWPIWNLIKDET